MFFTIHKDFRKSFTFKPSISSLSRRGIIPDIIISFDSFFMDLAKFTISFAISSAPVAVLSEFVPVWIVSRSFLYF